MEQEATGESSINEIVGLLLGSATFRSDLPPSPGLDPPQPLHPYHPMSAAGDKLVLVLLRLQLEAGCTSTGSNMRSQISNAIRPDGRLLEVMVSRGGKATLGKT